jgi:hypothetical protein
LLEEARHRGISQPTLNRAGHELGLKPAKVGTHWYWMKASVDPRTLPIHG